MAYVAVSHAATRMRLRFCCLAVLLAATSASAQGGLTVVQHGERLVLLNETAGPVTLDSVRIASLDEPYGASLSALYRASLGGERVDGQFHCSPYYAGGLCLEGEPTLFGRGLVPGDSVRFVSFEYRCDVCRGLAPRAVRDTMRVYSGGVATPLSVVMLDELFVASEARPEASALRLEASPNPSRGASVVTVARGAAGPVRVAVFDALGREVAVLHDGPAAEALGLRLDTSAWAPGVYVVRAVGRGEAASVRLVVAR